MNRLAGPARVTLTAHGHRMPAAQLAHGKRMGRLSIWTNAPVVQVAQVTAA